MRSFFLIAFSSIILNVSGQDYNVTGPYTSPTRTTCGAGNDCGLESSEDHQYQVTIPTTGNWTFSLCASSYDTRLYLGSTLCSGDLGFNDDACGLQSEVTATLTPGTYHVTIEGWSGSCGDYILDISTVVSGGPGSDCSAPIALNSSLLPYSHLGQNTNAYGDNYSISTCSNSYIGGDEVIYTYTAGAVAESLDIAATFTASWGGIHVLDDCPDVATTCIASSLAGTATSASVNCINIPAGETYYIVLSTFPSPQNVGYDLTIDTCVPAGPEDDCAGAIPAMCGDVLTGNTSGYNADVVPFCGTGDGSGGGIWYNFIGTGDFITASLCGSDFDTKIRVYEGTCPSLVCVDGSDDDCGSQSETSFLSSVGTSYYILVHGFGSATGNYILTITCGTPPVPGAEDCAGAVTVCSSATFTGNSTGSGSYEDLNTGNADCLSVEHQSSWYFFQAATPGTIAFEIITAVDYDFAVWGPYSGTPECAPSGTPLRCSFSGTNGNTGLQTGSGDISEGAGGDAWVDPINAVAGNTYVLVIDNWSQDFSSFDLNWNLGGGATLECTPLPIELLTFSGQAHKDVNILEWTTVSEVNNAFFTIERSRDGTDFIAIGTEHGAGNSSELLDYSFVDSRPLQGENYYRLKQTDHDGSYEYFNTILVTQKSFSGTIEVFPNPVKDQLILLDHDYHKEKATARISTIRGERLLEFPLSQERTLVDVTDWQQGLYILEVNSIYETFTQMFLKE
jgi:hypothetical protein